MKGKIVKNSEEKIRKARKDEHMKKANAFMETMKTIGVGSGAFQDQTAGIWKKRSEKRRRTGTPSSSPGCSAARTSGRRKRC